MQDATCTDPLPWTRPLVDLDTARSVIIAVAARLAEAGVAMREPPPEPTTCCGRGCNGCVWQGFYDALAWWREEALDRLGGSAPLT